MTTENPVLETTTPPLGVIMQQLQQRLPVNDFGLSEGIYRPDVLANILSSIDFSEVLSLRSSPKKLSETRPTMGRHLGSAPADEQSPSGRQTVDPDGDPSKEMLETSTGVKSPASTVDSTLTAESARVLAYLNEKTLAVAFVSLSYSEGFPTLPNGTPVWTNLEFEPLEAFQAFLLYQAQGRVGVRQLLELTEHPEIDSNVLQLQEYSILYSWELRVKAFDLFWMAERRRQREIRAMEVDDSQFLMSNRLMDIAETYMNGDEFIALMTPKTAIDIVALATKLQRIAVGLPGQGPAAEDAHSAPAGAPIEVILKQIVKSQGGSEKPKTSDNIEGVVDFLDDEGNTALAQELIIKMGSR